MTDIFLMHADGSFVDSATGSTDGGSATNNGVDFSTTNNKFGSSAFDFDGSSYFSLPNHSDFRMGSTFTVDCWVRCTADTGGILSLWDNDGVNKKEYLLWVTGGGEFAFYFSADGSSDSRLKGSGTEPSSILKHVAATFDSSTVRLFVGGLLVDSVVFSGSMFDSGVAFEVGRIDSRGYYFNGQIDEIRIANHCEWTANFTPPTEPYSSPPHPGPSGGVMMGGFSL